MLHGRVAERARLDDLLAGVRTSCSSALLIRGEPGVGKSALLRWMAERAPPARCLIANGVESELELPFAVLHQLLRPVVDRLDALPAVQADALRGALGLASGRGNDRFLVAVGVLTLLAEVATDRGVVCLVDDMHWADAASVDALLFVARRLEAEGVLIILFARESLTAPGLPELVLAGLDIDAGTKLLAEHAPAAAVSVSRALVERTDGNPLALVELPAVLTVAQLKGEEPLPDPLPVGTDIERVFAAVAARLPDRTRLLLTVVAADDTGRLTVIGGAAEALGLDLGALDAAESVGLVRLTAERVVWRHPLARSAVYQQAPFGVRQAAHRSLAASLGGADQDRSAWHRAAAAVGPDVDVAAALEASAARAWTRSGPAVAAAALRRAAELSEQRGERGRLLVAAAEVSWMAGRPRQAVSLLDAAEPLLDRRSLRAMASGLRGLVELSAGRADSAYPLLLAGALNAEDPCTALSRLALAGEAATLGGRREQAIELGRLAKDRGGDSDIDRSIVDMLAGVADVAVGDWRGGAARLARVVRGARMTDEPIALLRAGQAALLIGDDLAARRIYSRAAGIVRRTGAIGLLATTLDRLAFSLLQAGQLADAEATCAEGLRIAHDLGQQVATAHSVLALVAAWRGDEEACRRHAQDSLGVAPPGRLGAVEAGVSWALGLLALGLGRPEEAVTRLAPLVDGSGPTHPGVALWATPDLVEAAARAGTPEKGRTALRTFGAWASHVGAPWAIAVALRGAAQLADGDPDAYVGALEQLDGVERLLDQARTQLLLGEALRRRRRRIDARAALRSAAEVFDRSGANPWAERARVELRATGESMARHGPARRDLLTPQELQISRLVAGGASNPEIAMQLFLSRKTVEYHLHKIFTKLGLASRVELARLNLEQASRMKAEPGSTPEMG